MQKEWVYELYTVDFNYVEFLKCAEEKYRGFTRVPKMDYGKERKPKFLLGVVLQVNNMDYYVPVTSYKLKKPDNFLIEANNGQIVSSLWFNYMFPVPPFAVSLRRIDTEPDRAYRALLAQELRYCLHHEEEIKHLAQRTYKKVILGKDQGLVVNSCHFPLLEEKCREYIVLAEKEALAAQVIAEAEQEATELLAQKPDAPARGQHR